MARKIRGTAKITVKRRVQVIQRMQYTSSSSTQKELNNSNNQMKPIQQKLVSASRRQSIPSGVYSRPTEELFYALNERRKSDDAEAVAIYDVFISHASEDKQDFVDPLVKKLQDSGIVVWYDTLEMQWGKSLREQIDNGIKRSKFAIIILSKNFFAKKWPQRELDGILAKESITGSTPLPIWHNITQEELYELSPTLSGVFAYSSDKYSIDEICNAFELILEKENT